MSCTTSTLYKSIEACPGKKIMPGIRRRLYYIDKASIVTFPTLPDIGDASVTTMENLARLSGNFALLTDHFFQFIDLKDEASNVTFETVGEDGSKLFHNQATAIVAGQPDEVKGFARQALNDDILYVYQNRDGSFAVLGNEMFKCRTSPSGDTAAEASGATTTTLAIDVCDVCPVPTYVGQLPLSPTSHIDCSTGLIETVSTANTASTT